MSNKQTNKQTNKLKKTKAVIATSKSHTKTDTSPHVYEVVPACTPGNACTVHTATTILISSYAHGTVLVAWIDFSQFLTAQLQQGRCDAGSGKTA
jgi:hypothetical protein